MYVCMSKVIHCTMYLKKCIYLINALKSSGGVFCGHSTTTEQHSTISADDDDDLSYGQMHLHRIKKDSRPFAFNNARAAAHSTIQ